MCEIKFWRENWRHISHRHYSETKSTIKHQALQRRKVGWPGVQIGPMSLLRLSKGSILPSHMSFPLPCGASPKKDHPLAHLGIFEAKRLHVMVETS